MRCDPHVPVENVVLCKQIGSLLLVGACITAASRCRAAQPPGKGSIWDAIQVVEQQPGGSLEVELLGVVCQASIACPSMELRGRLFPGCGVVVLCDMRDSTRT